jgi:capsular exopolysaccharide synthesis family protein
MRIPAPTLWSDNEQTFKLDLSRLLLMLWARKQLFALTFSTIVAIALLLILSLVPRYEAMSSVIIAPDEPIVEVRSMLAPLSNDSQAVTSEIQVVRSKPLVDRVIDEVGYRAHLAAPAPPSPLESLLGLSFDDTFEAISEWLAEALGVDILPSSELPDTKVFGAFQEHLEVARLPNTSVLSIEFTATDPVVAANAVNQLAEEYVASQVEGKRLARANATALLMERLHQLRERMNESDQALERFRTESGLIKSAGVELLAQQVTDQTAQLATVRAQQVTLEARLAELEALQSDGASDQLYELLGSPVMEQLRAEVLQLQRDMARQSKEYGPRHPFIVQLAADLREANSRLDEQVSRAIEALRSEASMATARNREINQAIATLKTEIADLNSKDYRLRQLEGEAEINRSLHDAVVNRMREAEDVVFERADARILNQADVPTDPASLHRAIFLALALAGAFCVSSGLALGVELLNGGFGNEEELAGASGLPVLAAVPRASAGARRGANGVGKLSKYGSAYKEAFHALHTRLELGGLRPVDGMAPVVLITSAVPGEGKSTIVGGLARLAIQAGSRVLVIDCDFRRPSLHVDFGINNQQGLSTTEERNWSQLDQVADLGANGLVQVDPSTGVHVIPAGPGMPNPQRFLRSAVLPRIIASGRAAYDLILIDTSPVLAVADPMLIGRRCDVVALMAVKWRSTPRRSVQRALARMSAGDVPVAGCVFNNVDPSVHKADTYRYLAYS